MKKLFYLLIVSLFPAFFEEFHQLNAVTQNPLTGRTKGKYANAVFTKWKGLNVLKSKPLEVRNPQTAAQTAQRVKFNLILQFFRNIASVVNLGFKQYTSDMSAYNKFMSTNLLIDGITSGDPQAIDYSKIIVSKGTLTGLSDLTLGVISAGSGNSGVTWTDNSGQGNALATDVLCSIAFNEDSGIFDSSISGDPRETEGTSIIFSPRTAGDTFHVWCFFRAADNSIISDSSYVTGVVQA
jgi:hypothetical protein